MNGSFKKIILAVGILFITLLNVLSQDTLTHKYISSDDFFSSQNVEQYIVEDSVFVNNLLPDCEKLQCYFRKENGKWLMRYDSDWMIFFDPNESKSGSWNENIAEWEKTSLMDNAETIYKFYIIPLYNEENPLKLEDGTEMIHVQADVVNPYYFTYSSGIIGYSNPWMHGLFIREDKVYLEKILREDLYQK